jgi:hypothetical protein
MEKKWFECPVCGYKICKTDEKCVGGVYIKCKKHGGEVEVKHQASVKKAV